MQITTNLGSIKPEQIRVRDRILSVCSHGECEENRIWDFDTCWIHLTDSERQKLKERLYAALRSGEDLSGIVLTRADLSGFDFSGANLSRAFFNGCDLSNCKFIETNLQRAFFGAANLSNADLTRAELDGTVFTGANLEHVRLLALSISFGRVPINIEMRNFGGEDLFKRPQIDEGVPFVAEATYRALKAHFSSNGDYNSASWASYCERLMQSKVLWQTKKYHKWFATWLFGALCGYGEKPLRSVFASLVVAILYASIYQIFNLITQVGVQNKISWLDSLYFSFATFCGYAFPDILPKADSVARLVVSTEAFMGIFALGLFVFTLTKRYVAR